MPSIHCQPLIQNRGCGRELSAPTLTSSRYSLVVTVHPGLKTPSSHHLRGFAHIISFCPNAPTQGSPIVMRCWKHKLSSVQMLHKESNQMFQFYFCLGCGLLSCWTSQNCPVFTRQTPDPEESCAAQSLTPAEVWMFTLSKKAVLCPVFFALTLTAAISFLISNRHNYHILVP